MKRKLLSVSLVLLASLSFGQELYNNYVKTFAKSGSNHTPLITTLKNGNYLITQDTLSFEIDVTTGAETPIIGKLAKAQITPKAIVANGDYIYVAGSDNNFFPAIAKLDMNLDTVWNKHIVAAKYQNASALLVENDTVYSCGSDGYSSIFIAKMDQNGDTLWTTSIPQTTFANLTCLIKLSDGNFLAGGNLDDYPLAIKFDPYGNVLWTYTEEIFISFSKASAFEKFLDTQIVLMARNQFITLDGATGVKVESKSTGYVDFYDAIKTDLNTLYLLGTHKDKQYNGNQYPVVEVRYLSLDSIKNYTYTSNVHPLVNNSFTRAVSIGGIETGGVEFVATGLVRDSINLSANEWNIMAAKFNGSDPNSTAVVTENNNSLVYPNPSSGLLNFSSNVSNVVVYSLLGKQVATYSGNNYVVDISSLKAGSYFITWSTNGQDKKQSIVIKK